MQQAISAVTSYIQDAIKRNTTVVDNNKEQSEYAGEYIQSLIYLKSKPIFLMGRSGSGELKALWNEIRDDKILYDFVTMGTYYLEMLGWNDLAHRSRTIRHISNSVSWLSKSQLVDTPTKSIGLNCNSSAESNGVLDTDPWIVFIAIFQVIPFNIGTN